jgi:hypothetical protein
MKPAWDSLMEEYAGHKSTLVADVDCTGAGKPLCDSNGVSGYPTIKHGDPAALEDYSGGRDADSLKTFAAGLKPVCSPNNIDLCDDESRAALDKLLLLSDEELTKQIDEGEAKIKAAEDHFNTELEKLQSQYQDLVKNRDDTVAAVKSSGLGQLKSVRAHKRAQGSGAKDEL